MIRFLVDKFKPIPRKVERRTELLAMPHDKFVYYRNKLDLYTTEILLATGTQQSVWNVNPPRGVDMKPGMNIDINIKRLNMNYELPSFDEDSPPENTVYKLSGLVLNWKFVGFEDVDDDWDNAEDAMEFREKVFSLPPVNVEYKELQSDEAISRLAFFGLACHWTRKVRRPTIPLAPISGSKANPDQNNDYVPDPYPPANAVYVNDASILYAYDVRPPYERYGAYAYFDENFKVVGIYWCHGKKPVKPTSQGGNASEWDHAKWAWKASMFALVTIYDHLLVTHIVEANTFVTQTRKNLPVEHPLRQFLKPFTYHTVSVNYSAAVNLINDKGLVHRIWAFTYDEFLRVVNSLTALYRFKPWPQFIDPELRADYQSGKLKDADYPIIQDSDQFWNIVQNYVTDWLNTQYGEYDATHDHPPPSDEDSSSIYGLRPDGVAPNRYGGMLERTEGYLGLPKDDQYLINFMNGLSSQLGIPIITSRARLIEVLTQLIVNGTGKHEHVGQVSDYMMNPTFVGMKLLPDKTMQSVQTYVQQCALVVLTGLKMPKLLDDWEHLVDQPFKAGYRRFKSDLHKLQAEIDERNQRPNRRYPFVSFNPKVIDTSVSV
jgi:hypothetical protein